MKITNLHLTNFRQFEDLEINFPETSNIAVLIGENGCGKSTVLDAIAIHLQKIAKWAMTNDNIDFNEVLPSLNEIFIKLVEGTPGARQFQPLT